MKIKKSIINATAIVTLIGTISTQAFAMSNSPIHAPFQKPTGDIAQPMWVNTRNISADIFTTNTTITAEADVVATYANLSITGRMYLEKKVGNSWEEETSWALSGTGSVFKERNYPGEPGNTYRTRVVAFVNSERVEDTSSECTI